MKNLISFEDYLRIQESTDADGFNPSHASYADQTGSAISSLSDLIPGKEYVLTIDKDTPTDMIYQGVIDGVYVFNGEDEAEDRTFHKDEILTLIDKKAIVPVLE